MALTIEEQVVIDLSLNLKGLTRELQTARRQTQAVTSDIKKNWEDTSRAIRRTTSAVVTLTATVVGVYGIRAAKAIAHSADTWNLLEGRVRLVSNSYDELISKQTALFNIAQDSRVGYEQVADLYARIARNTARMNIEDTARISVTNAISKSLIISGASATSANAALVQLGQGLAAEALRGQELNSVMEQTPRLAQAIADGMGVSIGSLRKLAEEGKLTSEVVVNAIKSQEDAITKEFLEMPITMGQAMTTLDNAWMMFIGTLDDSVGITDSVVDSIKGMVMWFTNAGLEYKKTGTGFIDTAMDVMTYTDKWADVMVAAGVLVYVAFKDLVAYGKYVIIATGEAIAKTVEQMMAGIKVLLAKAKLEVMGWIQWMTSLKIGDSVIFEGPISDTMIEKAKAQVKSLSATYEDLGNGVSLVSKKAKAEFDAAVKQNAFLAEAARKRAAVTIAERKAELKWQAAVREFDKDFDDEKTPPPVTDLVDTKALAKAASEAAKAAREVLRLKKEQIQLILRETMLENAKVQLAYDQLGILLTERQEREMALKEAEAIVLANKKALMLAKAAAGDSTDAKVRLKVINAELVLIKSQSKAAALNNKIIKDTAKNLKAAGEGFLDGLTDGDFKGALEGLLDDVVDIFLDPIKDQMATLFGNTFSSIIGGAVDSIMDTMAGAATESIATTQAIGVANVGPAVSTSTDMNISEGGCFVIIFLLL